MVIKTGVDKLIDMDLRKARETMGAEVNDAALSYDSNDEVISKFTKEAKHAAKNLRPIEARFLVQTYYQMQEARIRSEARRRKALENAEPNMVLSFLTAQSRKLEDRVAAALDVYSGSHPVGIWAREQYGIGPVIAAGLLAIIDIKKAPTVGHILSYDGWAPGIVWNPGELRPWNANLRRLFWLIGESFVKVSNNPNAYYGHLYKKRKEYEWRKNLSGALSEQATAKMAEKNFGEDTFARRWCTGAYKDVDFTKAMITGIPAAVTDDGKSNGIPMLSPAHIHARAKRWAVKIFISHLHQVWYKHEHGVEPPTPYPIQYLGHVDYLDLPKEDYKDGDTIFTRHPGTPAADTPPPSSTFTPATPKA